MEPFLITCTNGKCYCRIMILIFALLFQLATAGASQPITTLRPHYGLVGARVPRITEHPTDLIVPKNEPATLQCKADGVPAPQIFWYKDHGELVSSSLSSSAKTPSGAEPPRLIQQNGALHFSRVIHNKKGKPDGGIYYCLARNQFGEARSRNASLQVAFLRDEFRSHPNSSRVAAGDTLSLECQPPRGFPQPKVFWRHNGSEVKTSETSRFSIFEEGTLVITDARRSDAGRYICVAENLAGKKESHSVVLAVDIKPSLLSAPQDVIALSEDTVIFECRVSGDPYPAVTWRKKNGPWPVHDGRVSVQEDGGLRIERVSPVDAGAYICQAENTIGVISAVAVLTVHSRPSFVVTPRDQKVAVGTTVSFDCLTAGNPDPAVFWTKDGSQILMFPGQPYGRLNVQSDGTLTIQSAIKEDHGLYSCSALSVAGSAIVKVFLEVTTQVSQGPPPIVTIGPTNQTLAVSSIAFLPCQATTPSVINWLKDGVLIFMTSNPRITLLESGLQISDLRISDSGIYTCLASSDSGQTMWSAGLIVESPTNPQAVFHRTDPTNFPAPPTKPEITNVTETAVALAWRSGSHFDSSITVRIYRIEYFSFETPTGWVIAPQLATSNKFIVSDLRPDTAYVFLVRVINSFGISPPSPVSDIVRTLSSFRSSLDYEIAEVENKFAQNLVQLVDVKAISTTAATLFWKIHHAEDEKFIAGYNIKYRDTSSATNNYSIVSILKGSAHEHTLFNMKKFVKYEFILIPFYKNLWGKPSNAVICQTLEDVPEDSPQDIRVHLVNLTAIAITWQPPPTDKINGRLAGFRIFVIPTGNAAGGGLNTSATVGQTRNISINQWDAHSEVIGNLTTGMRYRITIAARTSAGVGVLSKPLYIRMEPHIAGTADLLREPWFLGSLGGVMVLLLLTFFVMLFLRRKDVKLYKKSLPYGENPQGAVRGQIGIPFHPLSQVNESGTMMPNSIVGLCLGPSMPNSTVTRYDPSLSGTDWMHCDGNWAKQACQLNNGMFFACNVRTMERSINEGATIRREKATCPIHGHLAKVHGSSELYSHEAGPHQHGSMKLEPSHRCNTLAGNESGSSGSSRGLSYPETVSVHSQRSNPLADTGSPQGPVMSWADLIPPPPNAPPSADQSFKEDTDNYSAMDYKINKHALSRDKSPAVNLNDNMEKQNRIIEMINRIAARPPDVASPTRGGRGTRPMISQASLDRVHYAQRVRARDSFIRHLRTTNLHRARSCESSIANDDEGESGCSSDTDLKDVEFIDEEGNGETSPCLSSEASFFLETNFSRAVAKAVAESSAKYQTADPSYVVSETQPPFLPHGSRRILPLDGLQSQWRKPSATDKCSHIKTSGGKSEVGRRLHEEDIRGNARIKPDNSWMDRNVMTLPVNASEKPGLSGRKSRPKRCLLKRAH